MRTLILLLWQVFHVGHDERFAQPTARRLAALGDVTVADLLPRLAPRLRARAATLLRSFAVKPFALLAASFDEVPG